MRSDVVIGDAPTRAFIRQTVSHNVYHACERCWKRDERMVRFDELSAILIFEENIAEAGNDGNYQIGVTGQST